MSNQGWIKLHREMTDKPIWFDSTPEQKTILITLLMMANHREKEWEWKGERYKAEPGQFVTSLPSIVERCGKGVTSQKVRTALKRFEKYGFLTDESTNKNRLITIVNWGNYQGPDEEDNSLTNRQLTGNQQATNRQLTANKNVRMQECKNERKYSNSSENENPFVMYQECYGKFPSPKIVDELKHYLDDGMEDRLVSFALYKAARNDGNFGYARGILQSWFNKGIATYEQAVEEDNRFQLIKGGNDYGRASGGHETSGRESIVGERTGRIGTPTRTVNPPGEDPL